MKKSKLSWTLPFKGMAMGIAEVIPGVSGGTIAFITGIYERLINCIKSFDLEAFHLLRKFKWRDLYYHLDGNFIILMAFGMFLGIGIGVFGVGYLLESYPAPLWSFFFGLIVASAIFIGKMISSWSWKEIAAIIIGFVIAFGISFLAPAEGSENLIWVFLCGVIAISALILPGVSGSFILLMLGMYTVVRSAAESVVTEQNTTSIFILGTFMVGCLVGLLSFARVMSFAFKNYRNTTLSILTGFMLGSLRKLWPWRNVETYLDKENGQIINVSSVGGKLPEDIQIIKETLVLPESYQGDPQLFVVVFAFLLGFVVLFVFQGIGKQKV